MLPSACVCVHVCVCVCVWDGSAPRHMEGKGPRPQQAPVSEVGTRVAHSEKSVANDLQVFRRLVRSLLGARE
jgi:hypothetical protein